MNAKQKLNVIDLDNTLIPFDSFRLLLIKQIKNFNIRVSFFTALRLLRIISQPAYKRLIVDFIKNEKYNSLINSFANDLVKSIDNALMGTVQKHTDSYTINVLCSASPGIYVEPLADQLGWVGYGSNYYKGKFIHLYGENKISFITKKYPKQEFHYNFAVSDSKSDLELLKMFDAYLLVSKNRDKK